MAHADPTPAGPTSQAAGPAPQETWKDLGTQRSRCTAPASCPVREPSTTRTGAALRILVADILRGPGRQRGCFSQINNGFMARADIPPYAKLVFCYLDDICGEFSQAFPSRQTISKWTGVPIRSVARAVELLVLKGLLVVEGRPGTSNLYVVQAILESCHSGTGSGQRGTGSRARAARKKEQIEREQRDPSPDGSGDGLLAQAKPKFNHVFVAVRDLWSKHSPNYRFTPACKAALKQLWDAVEDLEELDRVLDRADRRRETEEFWKKRWSVKFVASQLGELMNEGDEDDGFQRGMDHTVWVYASSSLGSLGIHEPEGALRRCGFADDGTHTDDLWTIREFLEGRDTTAWAEAIKAIYRSKDIDYTAATDRVVAEIVREALAVERGRTSSTVPDVLLGGGT